MMRPNETRTIEPVTKDEDGNWDMGGERPPTIELSKKDAKQLYHGMFREGHVVELPDGSMGQLWIAPTEYERTLRGWVYVRLHRLKWRIKEKLKS